ncbi:MAG TPA: ATP-binding protein [Actinomycetes bacterium]|nr:ATP-binding protein [Actinomycetes bacterium]
MGGIAARRTVAAAGFGLLVTVAVLVLPSLRFAYRSTGGHLVLETAVTLVAALVALLLYGRYRRQPSLSTLLLVHAMSLLALAALLFVTLPGVVRPGFDATTSWAALVVRLVGALLVMAAALVPSGAVRVGVRPARDVALVMLGLVGVGAVTWALASGLPDVVTVSVSAEESGRPTFEGHPVVVAVQAVNLVCYAVAAVVFTRRSAVEDDELLGWVGAAAAVAVWARVCYLLFPSLYTDWLYVGDLLRLAMYLLLLVGAVREIRGYWEAQAVVAVDVERRRLARELHDGVVQELGYIRSESLRPSDDGAMSRISASAARALDETRRAMTALTAPPDEALAAALRRTAAEVGDRYDVPVELTLDETVAVPPDTREQLVRIAREAVSNAARHSSTPAITVALRTGCIEVADSGHGFDPSRGREGGFGLTSMRERAAAIGAVVLVESEPERGTKVSVTW